MSFNGTSLTSECDLENNAYNSTVNTNINPTEVPCRIDQYSIDLDSFDVSALVAEGDRQAEIIWEVGQDSIFTNYFIFSVSGK